MNQDLLDKKIDEFLEFFDQLNSTFSSKLSTDLERQTVKDIKSSIELSIGECTLPDQIRLNKRIGTLLVTLGSLASERVKQANVAYRWLRWKRHDEWNPAKKLLQQSMDKVLVGDIEQEVAKRTISEEMIESNIQGLADWMTTFHKDVYSYKSALQRQIDFNMKDYGSAQQTAE